MDRMFGWGTRLGWPGQDKPSSPKLLNSETASGFSRRVVEPLAVGQRFFRKRWNVSPTVTPTG